jgi:hypothetical protein
MGKGFVDLYLEPFLAKYEKVKYGYFIELKYITRGDLTQKLLQEKIEEAKNKLQQYATDSRIIQGNQNVNLQLIMLIFSGWKLIHWEEVT